MSDEKMVEVKYTGKMGTTAETPFGYLTEGDFVTMPEREARRAVKTGNYAYKGERIHTPDTTPTPDPIEEVLSAGPLNGVQPEPKKGKKK